MAGRGRGRGRGRGAVPPSIAQSMYSNFGDRQQQPFGTQATRPELSPKCPTPLIPEPPNMASFTEEELQAAEYADQLDRRMRSSVFFRPLRCAQYKIDRYSDRYLGAHAIGDGKLDRISLITTSAAFLPEELHALAGFGEARSRSKGAKTGQLSSLSPGFDEKTLLTLDVMAKTEESGALKSSEEEADDNDDDTGAGSEDASFGEDDFEDDTDYNLSYFDNGEDYGGGGGDYDDGGDNEAVF